MPDIVVDYEMSQHKFSIVHQEKASNVFGSTASKVPTHGQVASNTSDANKNKDPDVEELGWKNFNSVYYCERKEIFSYDGAQIPLTIVFSQKAWVKGQSPGILQGYGAYGEVLDKNWCTDRLSLLDRGWVVAFADVRLFPVNLKGVVVVVILHGINLALDCASSILYMILFHVANI